MNGLYLARPGYGANSSSASHISIGSELPSTSTTTCRKFASAISPCFGIVVTSPTARTLPRRVKRPTVIVTGSPSCTGLVSSLRSATGSLSYRPKNGAIDHSSVIATTFIGAVINKLAQRERGWGALMSALVSAPKVGGSALLERLDLCGKARLLEASCLCVSVVSPGLHSEHLPEIQVGIIGGALSRPKGGVRWRRHADLPIASRGCSLRPTNSGADRIFLVRLAGSPPPSPSPDQHERPKP